MRTPGRMVVGSLGELDALGLDLGGDRVDVLHRQSEMVEPLIGFHKQLWIFNIAPLNQLFS